MWTYIASHPGTRDVWYLDISDGAITYQSLRMRFRCSRRTAARMLREGRQAGYVITRRLAA
jgi:hypothetical protein